LKFRSLKTRVLFWFISIISIVLFLFSFLLYYFLEQSLNLRIQTNLYHNAILIEQNILQNRLNKKIIENINLDGAEVAIIKNGKIIMQTKLFTLKDYQTYLTKDEIFFLKEVDEYKVNGIYILKITKPFDGIIIIHKKGLSNKAEDIEDILLVLNPILLILLIIIGNKLIDKILIPIKSITKSAKNITIDNFSHTIDMPKNDDEIKALIISFNEMIIRLKTGAENLDKFNSDVSHELKTPLTIIQGELELSLKKDRNEEYYKKSIQTALNQTYEIKDLIDNLLILTKYDKQNIQDTFEECYLDTIFMNVYDRYEKKLLNKNITLHIDKLESIKIKANQILINLIFTNIIDNAIKYTPKNKNIYISLYKQKDKIYFIAKDEGIGISQDKLTKITNRFYRVDESRNKSIKGFGLGLSIVKNSICLHNGTLNINSKPNKGTIVTITF
jgi:signal transduction histidine kinase